MPLGDGRRRMTETANIGRINFSQCQSINFNKLKRWVF